MKKIFLALIMCMFLITMVSAVKLDYKPNDKGVNDMKAVVEDTILFGLIKVGEQGTMELKSHKSPQEIKKVGLGEQVTMIYETNFKDAYPDALGNVTFIDMRTKKEVKRDYEFVYWGSETRQRDACLSFRVASNSTIDQTYYECEEYGQENYDYVGWIDYNSRELPKGKITLGLKVEVREGDWIDGIWEVQGKKIDKHASWVYSLFSPVTMTDPTTPSPYVVDESRYFSSTYYRAWRAFSQLGDTMNFGSGSCVGDWARLDLGSGNTKIPALASVTNHQSDSTRIPTGFKAQGSNDGSSWTDLATFSVSATTGQQNNETISTSTAYRYFRILVTTSSSGGSCGFDKIYFYEQVYLTPTITLNSPANATNYNYYPTVDLNATVSSNAPDNVTLFIDDVGVETNTSGILGDYIFDYYFGTGKNYTWNVQACNEGGCVNGSERVIVIDVDAPEIELSYPPNNLITETANQNFYAYVTDDWQVVNVSFYYDGSLDQTNSSGLNASNYTFAKTLTEGSHTWYIEAYDNDSLSSQSATRTITLDTTDPTVFPSNLTDLNTFTLPINSTWSILAYDPNLDDCYYNTSDDATQKVVSCNATISDLEWTTEGNKTIQMCANDTLGHETCRTEYLYVYYLWTQTASSNTHIAEGFDFTSNMTVNRTSSIPSTTAIFEINNTNYSVTGTLTGSQYLFEKTINIPDTWGSTTGNTVNWKWYYTIDGIGSYNTTDTGLIVYKLGIDDCSAYGDLILNMSLRDEELKTEINETNGANFEIDLRLTSKDDASDYLDYSKTWTDENNPLVCIPYNVLNFSQYWMDFTIGFQATDHVWEFYYIDDGTLNSTKIFDARTTTPLNLYDLLTDDSTSFLFNYYDQDGLPVDDIIVHVYRKYIGDGVFREVERAKADQNGDTIVHLVEEDVIYYFEITQYGDVLFTSSTYTALCQATPCTIQIEASGEGATFSTDWDLINGGGYTILSSASTRMINLTYLFNESKTLNLTIYKYNSDGSYSSVNTSSVTGESGSILMHVPQSAGNVSFFSSVWIDGDFINSEWIDFEEKAQDRFGITLSLFLGALIILSLSLMAVTEGTGTLVFAVLGVAVAGFLGLINTKLSTGVNIVIYLVVAGGILIWKLTKGRS